MAFLRPNDDAIDGNWLNDSGSNVNLYASLNETTAVDTSYIQSPANPANEVCKIALSNPTGTLTEPFVLRYRYNNIGGATLTVRLLQGTTEIAAWPAETDAGWTTKERTLTSLQFAAITDFTELYVELKANNVVADPTLVLDLDFTAMTGGLFDNRVTFSRTTDAMEVGSTGLIQYGAANHFPSSNDFSQSTWLKGPQCTLGSSTVTAPDGTATAQTVTMASGADPALYRQVLAVWAPGIIATMSVWAKKSASGGATHFRFSTNNTSTWNTGISQKNVLTTEWQRFSVSSAAMSSNTNANIGVLDTRDVSGTPDSDCFGSVDLWGPQLEFRKSIPSVYVKNTTVGGVYGPRFDHDPVTLAARGLFMETQSTNVTPYSEDTTHASWTTFSNGDGSTSRTANAAVAPDGNTTADLVTINRTTSVNDWAMITPTNGSLSGIAVGSVYLKAFAAGDIGRQVAIALHNGTSFVGALRIYLTAGWQRYSVTGTVSGTANFIIGYIPYIDGGPDINGETKFYCWGAQTELGTGAFPFATSYIPTTSVAVLRAADTAVMTGTNFSSWYPNTSQGTFVVDSSMAGFGVAKHLLNLHRDGAAADRIVFYNAVTDWCSFWVSVGGTASVTMDPAFTGTNTNSLEKWGMAFNTNDVAASFNGAAVVPDTSATIPTNLNTLALGAAEDGSSRMLYGHIHRLRYYNVRKTNVELQGLTAL